MKKNLNRMLVSFIIAAVVAIIGGWVFSARSDAGEMQIFLTATVLFVIAFFMIWRTP